MSQKNDRLQLLNMLPWRDGLLTAGHRTSIQETALWEAEDITAEIDGMLTKRPGLQQYGQTIKQPDGGAETSTAPAFVDFLNGWAGFATVDTGSVVVNTFNQGAVQASVEAGSGGENFLASYSGASSNTDWTFRFMFRGVNLPASPGTTADNTIIFRVGADATSGKEFGIWAEGIYYQEAGGTYELIAGTEYVGLGGWHSIEISCDDTGGGSTLVYVDETLVATIASSLLNDVTLTAGSLFEFKWEVEGTGDPDTQYSTYITTPMYNDVSGEGGLIGQQIVAVKDFRYISASNSPIWALIAAAGDYIYHDNFQEGIWRPLHPKQHSNVFVGPYRNTILWTDNDGLSISSLWQWNGVDAPELLDDAPFIKFFTEHQQRVWASDGIQLFYSADRQPNVWFSPSPDNVEDQFDVVINAGYLEVPSGRGNIFRALFGDYYGVLIANTRHGVYRVLGSGPNSYAIDAVDQNLGTESERALSQVGNDLWFMSREGVNSLATTDQFGDLKAAQVSIDIADLWLPHPDNPNVLSLEYLNTSILAYNQPTSLVLRAVPPVGEIIPTQTYVNNRIVERWFGPWNVEATAMANVELISPIREIIMIGNTSGQIATLDQVFKADFGTDEYTASVASAGINGRSIDPSLQFLTKTWQYLRIGILPRGNWSITVEYWTDNNDIVTKTFNQLSKNSYVLGNEEGDGTGDFRLDINPDGRLSSAENFHMIRVTLNARGRTLYYRISQDGLGHDMALVGAQVQFKADGFESDKNAD